MLVTIINSFLLPFVIFTQAHRELVMEGPAGNVLALVREK
jgi:hypothetical protein